MQYSHLTIHDRLQVERMLGQGFTKTDIARALGKDRSTIQREIKRNTPRFGCKAGNYNGVTAQKKTQARAREKNKAIRFTEEMKNEVRAKLKDMTPELISGRARAEGRDFVSHETIYLWIYSLRKEKAPTDPDYELYKLLPCARRKRLKRSRVNKQRGILADRVGIDQRPASANNRSRVGHMEGDLVIGKGQQGSLLVLTDRKLRVTFIRKLKTRKSEHTISKVESIIKKESWIKSVTFDNDPSFANHLSLSVPAYFTRPYYSQDKGSVENRNKLIRLKYPKKTKFTEVNFAQIRALEEWINNRPMKMFGFKTPKEMLESHIFKRSVALDT